MEGSGILEDVSAQPNNTFQYLPRLGKRVNITNCSHYPQDSQGNTVLKNRSARTGLNVNAMFPGIHPEARAGRSNTQNHLH
jgi:hypothetical protein